MEHDKLSRRQFLALGAGTTSALLLPTIGSATTLAKDTFNPDLWIELAAVPQRLALRSGPKTRVWSYQARVRKGGPDSAQRLPNSYLGPVLHAHRGQKIRVDFVNELDEPSIVNWHGLHVPADMMGFPRYEVGPGQRYRYEFEIRDRAGTYWYHAFPAGHTPEQVYFGLAGVFVVSDEEEQALPLPRGEYDVPLVIQDRTFGEDNQLRYLPHTGPGSTPNGDRPDNAPMMGGGMMSGMMGHMMGSGMMGGGSVSGGMMAGNMRAMMTRMMGFFGDTILVNGQPNATLKVVTRAYRLRLLNASNARTYKLAWADGRPLTVIATGGGLLERPLQKDYVMLTPGQRIELWADFSNESVGAELTLVSRAFSGSMGSMGNMMGRMMSGSALPDGAEFPILKINVTRKAHETNELPQRLSTITRLRAVDAVNRNNPRTFRITMGHMRWGFNGHSFRMKSVVPNEIVKLGTTEIWEFDNNRMMAHAIHLHGLQFQVLERLNSPQNDSVVAGYVDDGWEDTILIMPNERVRLLMRFTDYTGYYAYQCHMLEHAADGVMRNYLVQK